MSEDKLQSISHATAREPCELCEPGATAFQEVIQLALGCEIKIKMPLRDCSRGVDDYYRE